MSYKPTIFIVDNNPAELDALSSLLHDDSNLIYATTGAQAVSIAMEIKSLDCVLMNIALPDMDGYEVCTRLKLEPKLKDVPVIFIAQSFTEESLTRALNMGGSECIDQATALPLAVARIKNQLERKYKTDLLAEIALLDGLTSIPNRERFDSYLDIEWRRSLREFNTLSVLMIDIDGFNQFSEHYGLGVGEECLKRVARVLQANCLRAADMVARYGSDEFVALLPGIELENALIVAENMVRAVANLGLDRGDGSMLTISAGVASIDPTQDNNSQDLMDEAEEVMGTAQQAGGNQSRGIAI